MLNLSKNNISNKIDTNEYRSFKQVQFFKYSKPLLKICYVILAIGFVTLFLPWTQNIQANGYLTTLQPDKRPQEINSVIAGKIEKWYVREGVFVEKGDTIIHLSEVKDAYFDPELLDRQKEQIEAKQQSVEAYGQKVQATDVQIEALQRSQELKMEQARNKLKQAYLKLQSDSINLEATKTNLHIAQNQFERTKKLYEQGLKSLTDLEIKKVKYQEEQAKLISNKNYVLQSENNILNAKMEIITLENEYKEKLAKSRSERFSTISSRLDEEVNVSKFKNTYKNYEMRNRFYYITAPQSGYITKINKAGIGEIFKEGDPILTIVPIDYELALEMYVRPIDIPLVKLGGKTRINFDGWPSIVFSGWPNISFGTFGGEIIAIDRNISENGLYRVMVAPDKDEIPWPHELNIGSGGKTITLLNTVPVWYEMWRQFNGFPPDYYIHNQKNIIKKTK